MQHRIGKLRHYCTIEEDTSNDGDELPSFTTFMSNVPCNVYDVSGGETFRGKQVAAEINTVIEMRWYTGITHEMRIVTPDSRTLNIVSKLDRSGRSRYLELHCSETST